MEGAVIPSESILQGPSTKITIKGPDGSVISAYAPGGQVATNGHSSIIAQAAPVVSISGAVDSVVLPTESQDSTESADDTSNTTLDDSELTTSSDVKDDSHAVGNKQDATLTLDSHDIFDGSENDYSEKFYDDGSYHPDIY